MSCYERNIFMSPKEELFEQFGKQFIERARDSQIQYADMFLDQEAPLSNRYKNELETLSPAQIEMLKKMVVRWIDGTLHDFLFLLDGADWIELHLKGQNVE